MNDVVTPVTSHKVEKRSTSLYMSGAAMRTLRKIAADEGVRPHRIVDEALRRYFSTRGFDFDSLNQQD